MTPAWKRLDGFFFVAVGILATAAASAATITVNTTADNTIAGDGLCTLREAITNANDDTDNTSGDCPSGAAGHDEILFQSDLLGETINIASSALPRIEEPLTITGPGSIASPGITLDGGKQFRILTVGRDTTAVFEFNLQAIELANGRTSGDHEDGGAIRLRHIDATLTNIRIKNSSTTGFSSAGGAVYAGGGGSSLTITDSSFIDNFTIGDRSLGGAIASFIGSATISRCVFEGNATYGAGTPGGAVRGVRLAIANSVFLSNRTHGERSTGGALVTTFGPNSISRSLFAGNETLGADAPGGAIHHIGPSSFPLLGETLDIINATISGNHAAGPGSAGGALLVTDDGNANLLHVTVNDNLSADGASTIARLGGGVSANNSIFSSPAQSLCIPDPFRTINGENNLFTDISCGGTATPFSAIRLGPLTDNGGSMFTHALAPSSAAIDAAGDCVSEFGIAVDQRGATRPVGAACDIGAVEGAVSLPVPAGGWRTWLLLLATIAGLTAHRWRQQIATRGS